MASQVAERLCQRARTGSPPANRPRNAAIQKRSFLKSPSAVQERQRIRTRCTAGQNPVPEHAGQHSGVGKQSAASAERGWQHCSAGRRGHCPRWRRTPVHSRYRQQLRQPSRPRYCAGVPMCGWPRCSWPAQSALIGVAEADKYPSLSLLGAFNLSVLSVSGSPPPAASPWGRG